uniref:Bestrophin homolog n=1 Tax=Toxocara canis TaxID=6265 RepID=A0A183V5D0_TOXCA
LEEHEVERFTENNFYQSVSWALALARQARDEGIIRSDPALQDIFRICMDFRWSQITLFYYNWIPVPLAFSQICMDFRWSQITLFYYNWIPVPLAFSQIISLVVRCYFILALLGRQFTHNEGSRSPIDIYFPAITVLQLVFYSGWVKVAEALINPCGDDDEDFDFEWFLARNMRQATAIADEKNSEPPPLCWDKFWRDQKEREQNTKSTVKRLGKFWFIRMHLE